MVLTLSAVSEESDSASELPLQTVPLLVSCDCLPLLASPLSGADLPSALISALFSPRPTLAGILSINMASSPHDS